MDNYIFYLIGFFVIIYISRAIGERAVKKLSVEQKAGLIDLFAKDRKYNGIVIFSVIIIFLLLLQFRLVPEFWALIVYFITMTALMLVKIYRTYSKLTANNYPVSYIKSIVFATALSIVGILVFFALIFCDLFMLH